MNIWFLTGIFFFGAVWDLPAQIKFGPEWTFTSKTLKNHCEGGIIKCDHTYKAMNMARVEIKKRCKTLCDANSENCCKIAPDQDIDVKDLDSFPQLDKYDLPQFTITYVDDKKAFSTASATVTFAADPKVIELGASPMTVQETQSDKVQKRMALIFDSFHSQGLDPDQKTGVGGGHIHMDFITAFGGNECQGLDYMAFLNNYPNFLMAGFKTCKKYNGPLSLLSSTQQKKFTEIQVGCRKDKKNFQTYFDLVKTDVYSTSPTGDYDDAEYNAKVQALNVNRVAKKHLDQGSATLELRAVSPQASFEVWSGQISFMEKLVNHVKTKGPINYITGNTKKTIPLDKDTKRIDCRAIQYKAAQEAMEIANLLDIPLESMNKILYPPTAIPSKAVAADKAKREELVCQAPKIEKIQVWAKNLSDIMKAVQTPVVKTLEVKLMEFLTEMRDQAKEEMSEGELANFEKLAIQAEDQIKTLKGMKGPGAAGMRRQYIDSINLLLEGLETQLTNLNLAEK